MKRLTYISLLLLALSGCAKVGNEDGSGPISDKSAISLALSEGTKAGIDSNEDLQGSGFGVFCYYTGESDFTTASAASSVMMKNQKVTFSSSVWTYSPTRYWPGAGQKLTFMAYAPYMADGITYAPDGTPRIEYKPTNLISSQNDILWGVNDAVAATDVNYGKPFYNIQEGNVTGTDYQKVPFTFKHATAKVVIKAKATSAITITSVVVEGMPSGGVLSLNNSEADKPEWIVTSSELLNYTINAGNGLQNATLTQGADYATIMSAIYAVPKNNQTPKVTVNYTLNGANLTKVKTLDAIDLVAGQAYSFNISIENGMFDLSLTTLPWDTCTEDIEYTSTVSVSDGGQIKWTDNTYSKIETGYKLLLKYKTAAICTFKISAPVTGTWYASFQTASGDMNAFKFLDADGNKVDSMSGNVGETASLKIVANTDYPSITSTAHLEIVVRNAGKTLPVKTLVDDSGSEWLIIQNQN